MSSSSLGSSSSINDNNTNNYLQEFLIRKEASFYNATVNATSHIGDHLVDDPQNILADTEAMIAIVCRFLKQSAPNLLEVFDLNQNSKSTSDRLVKIGRNLSSTMRFAQHKSSLVLVGGEKNESISNNERHPNFLLPTFCCNVDRLH